MDKIDSRFPRESHEGSGKPAWIEVCRYRNRLAAPGNFRTKTELLEQRLKPAAGQQPAAYYWQGFHYVALYDPALASSMRSRRAPSPAQTAALAAGRALAGTALCIQCGTRTLKTALDNYGHCGDCIAHTQLAEMENERMAVQRRAAELLANGVLFLDVETTGLDNEAEIIEIAILDADGNPLLDTLIKPLGEISQAASAVHGITNHMVAEAPRWPQVVAAAARILYGRQIVAHHAEFDNRMLQQTCARHSMPWPSLTMECTMLMLTSRNGDRWPSLDRAAHLVNAPFPAGERHRAKTDAELCRQIVIALAKGG